MKTVSNLPIELLRPIIQQIEEAATLASVCLASRLLGAEAQRVLYFSPTDFCLRRPNQHIRLLACLLQHDRFPPLVKSYRIPAIAGPKKDAIWARLPAVLPLMVNLKDLSLMGFSTDFNELPMDKIICQLESLTWVQIDSQLSNVLSNWLPTQKALRKLRWIYRRPVEIPPTACPNLQTLEGCFHVISTLLPGRNIKRLNWIADPTLKMCSSVHSTLNILSEPLQTLDLISFDTQLNAIHYHSLADHLPSKCAVELNGGNIESIYKTVLFLPNLRILILSTQNGYSDDFVLPDEQRQPLIQDLFAKSSTLVQVYVVAKLSGPNTFYECWENGSKREGLIPLKYILERRG
ncbi:hypothetical protein BDN70DRAFT_991539 [Pholiota conissans]|uniref:Uncharacterized protein n=1 Tax=Pholiota conissans TaxID=109636 RepID=A0A9P5Z5H0_9AGAR|nr:hypothetical protein BDN70DRAFT_991539 [Pholiota conissans]